MSGCCGPRGRPLSMAECIEGGLRTRRCDPLDLRGGPVASADGLEAAFSLCHDGGRLVETRFRCTSCITLVAYCEALRRVTLGCPLAEAGTVGSGELVTMLASVPAARRDRAVLAVAAFRSALLAAHDTNRKESTS